MMRSSTGSSGSGSGGGGGGGGGGGRGDKYTSCQDCGNKAKRDCSHTRCRTCCKSRGFQCVTHVRSTWVPLAHRRQRQHQHHHPNHHHQQQLLLAGGLDYHLLHHNHHGCHLSLPLSLSSHHQFHHHNSPSPGLEGGNFPAEVNSLATFRCIRVSSEDNVVDQFAYQTSINIGGHAFKGILYDQGPTNGNVVAASGGGGGGGGGGGESSSVATSDNQHQLFHHHQFDITATGATTATTAPPPHPHPSSGANVLYAPPHPSLYSAPFNAFLPGMQFFPHPRP